MTSFEADWTINRSTEVPKITEIKSEENNDQKKVDNSLSEKRLKANESAGSTINAQPEERDYSPSGSSWAPTDKTLSSEDSDKQVNSKTLKMEQYVLEILKKKNSKKAPAPNRPNAVVNVLQELQINGNNRSLNDTRKRKYEDVPTTSKFLPDSTQKKISPPKDAGVKINASQQAILEMKKTFEELFIMINEQAGLISPACQTQVTVENNNVNGEFFEVNTLDPSISKEKVNDPTCDSERSERSQSEESERSNDNVLITNKYHKIQTETQVENQKNTENEEWIPIGSGKTLIYKDKFKRVNWKSYTIATRTLLLATFPRRVLATHSLTGKRSPAFPDKPAKMCLDPKIVSDIIIEITSKFKVKENLVRGIITTKCADECKMFKQRIKNKKSNKGPPSLAKDSLAQQ